MSSGHGGIGSTLTSGIQDIAAILPLLGTQQCSDQVSSALTRGYLYAASTPMSIFGSLGVVSAGFKTLVACFSFRNIEGAKILGNMGFEPQGENLSLIMVEAGKVGKGKNTGRYIIETRVDEMIKELNIDKNRITGVSHKSAAWNVKMMATTALLCTFSIAPYIYLNRGASNLKKSTTWVFPVLRATGGFITTTLIQLLIQRRITTLSDQYLVKRDQLPNRDEEVGVEPRDRKNHEMDARTWLMLFLLLIGLVASVVGYVGCFSVVQNSTSTTGPVSWLSLEAGLSVIRLLIWAWNPTRDNAPPLEIILELDKYEHNPLPTCNKDNEEILRSKVLPLTRARDFLKIITSFVGLIEPFGNTDLSLYYTLTRKRPSKQSVPDNEEQHILGERTLYITVFDHKERTTRVYTRDNEEDTFYSTKSDAPFVDVGHFVLEVEIDGKFDPKGDPVSNDSDNLDSLRKHHRSILEHIQYRLGAGNVTQPYAIENSWTLKVEDSISTLQSLREKNGNDWERVVAKGKEEERNEKSSSICGYFMHPSIERERRLLDEKRVKWIARRMEMIAKETKETFEGRIGVVYRVDKQAAEKKTATKSPKIDELLLREQYVMNLLLLYEVKEWEQLFWIKFKAFLDQIGSGRVEEKGRLTREWRANCWKRLNPQMHAAQKRWADLGKDEKWSVRYFGEKLGEKWASCIGQLFGGVEKRNSISLYDLRNEIEQTKYEFRLNEGVQLVLLIEEIRLRMENEIEDTEFRLKRGSDLGLFDQFWDGNDDGDTLFECRYSRSKWLYLSEYYTSRGAPLEIYSHALKRNKNFIYISFTDFHSDSDVKWLQATVCDLPWVTSIFHDSDLPTIHRDPVFIRVKSTHNDLITFAKEIQPKLDLFSTYIFTDAASYDLYSPPNRLGSNARFLISFVGPPFGKSLVLRLKHSSKEDGSLKVTLGATTIQLNPSSKSSLTIDDITLYPIPGSSESDRLSFEPGIRNDIFIQFRKIVGGYVHGHFLQDIELLDEAGLEDPRNQIINVD